MKKLLLTGTFLLLGVFSVSAQEYQLPNLGFSNWKTQNGETTLTADNGSTQVRPGTEPEGWNASNINQVMDIKDLVTKVEENGNAHVKIYNHDAFGNIVPGYMTLATPWVFAYGSGIGMITYAKYGDGGSYGGVNFTYIPDAISLRYKKSGGTGETSHVIAYLWNGTFKSSVPNKVNTAGVYTYDRELEDVDRVVMGRQTDNISEKGTLIASVDKEISDDTDGWVEEEIPLTYKDGVEGKPEKMNVILSASDYWTRSNLKKGTTFEVDDVKFVYWSDLRSLSYDGTPINIEDPENIQIAAKDFDLSKVSCTSGKGADIQTSYNEGTRILTITIEGNDISVNSENHHEYSVKIVPPASEVTLTDDRLIKVNMVGTVYPSINSVTISESESKDGTVAFTMKNFTFAGAISVGDVTLTGATLSYADNGSINITAPEQELSLLEGAIYTKVSLNGNVAVVNGKKELTANVNINWYSGYPTDMSTIIPIEVAVSAIPFNTTLEGKTLKVTGSVAADEAAAVIPADADVNVVDLTGTTLTNYITVENFDAENPNTLFYAAEGAPLTGNNVVKGTECDNFVLTDGQSFNAPEGFTANQITYKRATAASTDEKDEVYTFVLPFTFTADKVNGTVYELTGVNDGVLDFTSLEGSMELKANRPYLVVSNGTQLLNASAFSGEVDATGDLTNGVYDGVTMVGAYEATPITSGASESWYGYNDKGQFVKANTGTINPFRTAIKSTGSQSSFALKLDGTVTGIVNLENPNAKVDVYTISGVCVRKNVPAASALNGLSRGVYIVGGQKVVK